MLTEKRILGEGDGQSIAVLYDSSNIPKTTYYPARKSLFIHFMRKRKNKEGLKPGMVDYNKVVPADGEHIIEVAVYQIRNVDGETYNKFESADSQGRFYNTYMRADPKFFKDGNFYLLAHEVEELLAEIGYLT